MEITLYDYITLETCGIWRVDPTATGAIVFKGIPDTQNEGCRLELHRSSQPAETPGYTLMACWGSDNAPYFYQVTNETFEAIMDEARSTAAISAFTDAFGE